MKHINFAVLTASIFFALLTQISPATAADPSRTAYSETIIFVQSPSDSKVQYETTIYELNDADATKPLVIINHGSNPTPRSVPGTPPPPPQPRQQSLRAARFFIGLGMTVVLPMRRGYSKSSGTQVKPIGNDLTTYGLENAKDIEEVVTQLALKSKFKNRKIIMVGQSTGGLATMAYASQAVNKPDAVINFHGGWRPANIHDLNDPMLLGRTDAFASYAKVVSQPKSLWLYTANDHSSTPEYVDVLSAAFIAAGGQVDLQKLPAFMFKDEAGVTVDDGHYLLDKEEGQAIWRPLVTRYLKDMGLIN